METFTEKNEPLPTQNPGYIYAPLNVTLVFCHYLELLCSLSLLRQQQNLSVPFIAYFKHVGET